MDKLEGARELALRYLDRRMRSRKELSDYLRRKRCTAPVIAAVVADLTAQGFLDDHAFAVAFARDRVRLSPRGYRVIEKELRERGVTREIAGRALGEVEAEHPEAQVARTFLASRRRRLETLDDSAARSRIFSWLRGRGFRRETIRGVIGEDDGA